MTTTVSKALLVGASMCAIAMPVAAQDPSSPLQDIIIVNGQKQSLQTELNITPDTHVIPTPDAASLIARLPGANVNNNGQISAQVQYRGLFGPRLNVRVDGARFGSGGPGWMDPPLHYAPMPLIEKIILDRGLSPVTAGPGLGGGANAILKKSHFTDDSEFDLQYNLTAGFRSIDDSFAIGGMAGIANKTARLSAIFSKEKGDDLHFPGGVISASQHERLTYGVSGGFKFGAHTFALDLRRQETNDTGNPPFPMDIRFFDSDFVRAKYKGEFGALTSHIEVGGADIHHAMTNFHLRPNPNPMRLRETFAAAQTRDGKIELVYTKDETRLTFGADTDFRKHKARITHPNNPNFFIDNVPIITENRYGIYGQWNGVLADWQTEFGGRVDWYDADAGKASVGASLPMGPHVLANRYNMSKRSWSDTTTDAVLRLWKQTEGPLIWRASFTRKSRAPGYLDRFAWLPTTASAGLADGNIYVGDLNINPETALSAEFGFDYKTDRIYARPSLYYRQIDDYIQGIPYDDTIGVIDTPVEMVARMNGDPTPLRFGNVDAKLYGFDVDFGMNIHGPWRLDGVASFVRGKRRDIDDNLYRVSPPNLRLSASYEAKTYDLSLEGVFVAKQTHVSHSNSERATAGHTVWNASAKWHASENVWLSAGIENILNTRYSEHLAGYNRIMNSDVPLGARLPGSGRGVFLKLSVR